MVSRKLKKESAGSSSSDGGIGDIFSTRTASMRTDAPSSAAPRKRLSGGTMNMRFMKQRKISTNTDESGQSRKDSSATNPCNARTKSKDSVNTLSKGAISRKSNVANRVSNSTEVTSVDMYGIEAALIGRRSFRGFNAPIERIWKDSKVCLENREASDRPRKKISDEELLIRYQESRGVGNLDKKRQHRTR